MANRDMTNQLYSFEKARKFVSARLNFGSSAVTLRADQSKGVLSCTRLAAGLLEFVFGCQVAGSINQIDCYRKLLSFDWIPDLSSYAGAIYPAALGPQYVYRNDLMTGFNLPAPVQSAVTLQTTGGSLSQTSYYYIVTAIDSAGNESLASNQITGTLGGSNTAQTVNWAVVPGAVSYRVYRDTQTFASYPTTSGCAVYAVAGGATTSYADTGAATQATPGSSSAATTVLQCRPPIGQGALTVQLTNGSGTATDPATLESANVQFEFGDSSAV